MNEALNITNLTFFVILLNTDFSWDFIILYDTIQYFLTG